MLRSKISDTGGTRGKLFSAGGRFVGGTDPTMEKFNESIHFDKRLWFQDIKCSIAYAKAIFYIGVLDREECDMIIHGLELVLHEWTHGDFVIKPGDEDIHTANERRLTEIIGSIGGKLHTGRSRNDQVATDTRLWIIQEEKIILKNVGELLIIGSEFALKNIDILTAGYTHLQPAQPIRFSHWLMSHLTPIMRDAERLQDVIPRTNSCPLGSGALAGNSFDINRNFLSNELGFCSITSNSLDATCDRDFILDFLMWNALFLTHLSQLAEDIIIAISRHEIVIHDSYTTGSSLMPQKKNPDALELLRGKAGLAIGSSVSLITILKGLPRAYNKDLQEDKVLLFESVDTAKDCLSVIAGIITTLKPNPKILCRSLHSEMLATDLADYLVCKGIPFREAHHISSLCIRLSEELNIDINMLTLKHLQSIDSRFEDDIVEVWDYESSVERKRSIGGTSRICVYKQVDDCIFFGRNLLS